MELKNVIDLLKMRLKLLFKSPVLTFPSIATVGFAGIMYSLAPIDFCSSYLISAVFLFFIGIFAAMSINGRENDVFEETLMLHSKSVVNYYISRELLLGIISLFYSLVLTIVPILVYLPAPDRFFKPLDMQDVAMALPYIFICGLAGMVIGDVLHPRLIKKRSDAVMGAILISILTVCKIGLIEWNPVFKILNFILPPVLDGYKAFVELSFFDAGEISLICIKIAIFVIILTVVKIKFLIFMRYRC